MLLNEDFDPDRHVIVARPPEDGDVGDLIDVYRAALRDGLAHWATLTIEFDNPVTWLIFAALRDSLTTSPLPGVTVSATRIESERLVLVKAGVH